MATAWTRAEPAPTADLPVVRDGLHAKMAEAQAEIESMPKDRTVTVTDKNGKRLYSYDYLGESSLMTAVRKHLSTRGVAVYVSVEDVQREGSLTTVRMEITFADSVTGETFSIRGVGQGADPGDKGAAKAITACTRYMLLKQFLVNTEKDDPDSDTVQVGADEPRADAPISLKEAVERLEGWVAEPQPWISEAVKKTYDIDLEGSTFKAGFADDEADRIDCLRRLQVVVGLLDADEDASPYLPNGDSRDPAELQAKVRSAFSRAFYVEGGDYAAGEVFIDGPDPFAPSVPF